MGKFVEHVSTTIGLPPGTPVYVGKERTEAVTMTVSQYDQDHLYTQRIAKVEECAQYKDSPMISWINVEGIHEVNIVEELGKQYGLHPLIIEDILNTHQRLKVDIFDDYLLFVVKMLTYDAAKCKIEIEQVSIVLGKNFVITFQEGKTGDVFGSIRECLTHNKGRLRKAGADFLAYMLLDAIVDSYFEVVEQVGEQIEIVEDKLLNKPGRKMLQQIHALRRELIFFRKAVWPLRTMIDDLERQETSLFRESTQIYLRDLYDHVIQVIDTIEIFRDMMTSLLDVYLSSASNKMNEIMTFLTIVGTIFIPLTFIAGVYGMNFKYMPELEWHYGYFLIWGVMLAIGAGLLLYFRKRRWL